MEQLILSAHGYVISKWIPLGLGFFHKIPGKIGRLCITVKSLSLLLSCG